MLVWSSILFFLLTCFFYENELRISYLGKRALSNLNMRKGGRFFNNNSQPKVQSSLFDVNILFPLDNAHVQCDEIKWVFSGHFIDKIAQLTIYDNATDYFIETCGWLDSSKIENFVVRSGINDSNVSSILVVNLRFHPML